MDLYNCSVYEIYFPKYSSVKLKFIKNFKQNLEFKKLKSIKRSNNEGFCAAS